MIYWFIGQPGSGKTTLAKRLKRCFDADNYPAIHLDGDDLRVIFGNTYSKEHFTKEYRIEQTRLLQRLVAHFADQGVVVIVSTVNPYRDVREEFKSQRSDLREIYVWTKDIRGREDRHVEDFEEPRTNHIFIATGDGRTEDDVFLNLCQYLMVKQWVCTMVSNASWGGEFKKTTKSFYDEKIKEEWCRTQTPLHGGFPYVFIQERQVLPHQFGKQMDMSKTPIYQEG